MYHLNHPHVVRTEVARPNSAIWHSPPVLGHVFALGHQAIDLDFELVVLTLGRQDTWLVN